MQRGTTIMYAINVSHPVHRLQFSHPAAEDTFFIVQTEKMCDFISEPRPPKGTLGLSWYGYWSCRCKATTAVRSPHEPPYRTVLRRVSAATNRAGGGRVKPLALVLAATSSCVLCAVTVWCLQTLPARLILSALRYSATIGTPARPSFSLLALHCLREVSV